MRRARFIFLLLAIFSFCSSPKRQVQEKTIRFPAEDWGFPSPLAFYPAGPGYLRMSLLFDTLVWKDKNGIIPWLAKNWQVGDEGKKWEFTLRKGVYFHDRIELTAYDVAFSYNYLKKHYFPWVDFSLIDSVQALSKYKVKFNLKEPYVPFLEEIAGVVPIIPKHIWQNVSDPKKFQNQKALIGTGPFILEKYEGEHGVYIYKANPNYFLGKPKIDKLLWLPCGDAVLGLTKGDIDAHTLWWQTVEAVDKFQNDSRYKIMEGSSDWILKLIFNTKNPLLNDPKIRQAIAYAINRQELCRRVKHNHAIPGNPGIILPYSKWYNPHINQYNFSLSKAQRLLIQAGFDMQDKNGIRVNKKGEHLSFTLTFSPEYSREAEFIQKALSQIGIKIKFRTMDLKTLFNLLNGKWAEFDLALNGHGGVAGDPDMLRRWFAYPYANNGFWQNEQFQKLAREQKKILSPEKRKQIIDKMQEIIANDLPVLVLWYPKIYFVYNPKVWDNWFFTAGGIAIGIPSPLNKLAFLPENAQ